MSSFILYPTVCLVYKANRYKSVSREFCLIHSGREIPASVKQKYLGTLERHLYGRARLTRFVFPAFLQLYRTLEIKDYNDLHPVSY